VVLLSWTLSWFGFGFHYCSVNSNRVFWHSRWTLNAAMADERGKSKTSVDTLWNNTLNFISLVNYSVTAKMSLLLLSINLIYLCVGISVYSIYSTETIKRQTRAARVVVWLERCKPLCAGLAYSLQAARQLCLWRTALLQLPLVALYKCYAFTVHGVVVGFLWSE